MNDSSNSKLQFQSDFFKGLGNPLLLMQLFDFLPDIYVYAKNTQGQYVRANKVVCHVFGVDREDKILGLTDFDFFPPAVAAQYVDEDRRVINSNAPLADQIWLVSDSQGIPRLYLCNKIPLTDEKGNVIGIAGVKRPYSQLADVSTGHERLMQVVEFVTKRYEEPITVKDLADEVQLSTSQLHREFSKRFGITPNDYIREVRIGVARYLLESEFATVGEIALRCGFYDQSHFTKSFKTSTGITPLQYRKRFSSTEND